MIDVRQGDVIEVLRGEADESYTCCLCDPPYGLGKTPDMAEVLGHWLGDTEYENGGGGFMGKPWDSFVPGPLYWKEVYRVLRPGAVLLAFAGTRTVDLLSIAIRLAGFEKFDEIDHFYGGWPNRIDWIQGSGFPKSTAIDKQIDKAAGKKREVVGTSNHIHSRGHNTAFPKRPGEQSQNAPQTAERGNCITAPATPLAKVWHGHGTGLKPSHEIVIVARKPSRSLTTEELCYTIVGEHITSLLEVAQWERSQSNVGNAEKSSGSVQPKPSEGAGDIVASDAQGYLSDEESGESAQPVASSFTHREAVSSGENPSIVAGNVATPRGEWQEKRTRTGKVVALSVAMDMLPSELKMANIDSNTMSLWKKCLVDVSCLMSKFTTEMKIELITDLKILNSLLSQSIFANITPANDNPTNGLLSPASIAGRNLSVAAKKWSDILEPIAAANVGKRESGPNHEIILCFRKPRAGLTYAQCATQHATGSLAIDASRVSCNGESPTAARRRAGYTPNTEKARDSELRGALRDRTDPAKKAAPHPSDNLGRWPANLLFSHSPGCVRRGTKRVRGTPDRATNRKGSIMPMEHGWNQNSMTAARQAPNGYANADGLEEVEDYACVEGCPIAALNEQAGVRKSGAMKPHHIYGGIFGNGKPRGVTVESNEGPASRFFQQFDGERFIYSAKASRRERDAGLGDFELGGSFDKNTSKTIRRVDPDTGKVTFSEFTPSQRRNGHPTVKPLSVCKYISRLIRPPDECLDDAALLVPFCGSGSEMIGALLAGWRNVIGIDIMPEYVDIAKARIKWWQDAMQSTGLDDPKAILKAMKKRKPAPLFDLAEAAE